MLVVKGGGEDSDDDDQWRGEGMLRQWGLSGYEIGGGQMMLILTIL